jgi:Glycosyltransferase family 87
MNNEDRKMEDESRACSPGMKAGGKRQLLAWGALTALVVVILAQSTFVVPTLPYEDFPNFWAAGVLILRGDNPYDLDAMERQRPEGMLGVGPILWYPPWTLPLVMPLGLLPPRVAHLLWLLLHLGVMLCCLGLLWQYYDGPAGQTWLALLLGLSFFPTPIALESGHIVPLVLLGIVAFLHLERRGADVAAGASLGLAAIKPHLVLLFGAAVLLWAVWQRRWRVLLGGGLAGLAALAIPLAFNPRVLQQYLDLLHRPAELKDDPILVPLSVGAPSLSRMLANLGLGNYFLPPLCGLAWLAIHWWRRRARWNWAEETPLLVLVSMFVSSYGAYPYDLILFLVPILQVAAASFRRGWDRAAAGALAFFLLTSGYMALVMLTVHRVEWPVWWGWLPASYLIMYVVLRGTLARAEAGTTAILAAADKPG